MTQAIYRVDKFIVPDNARREFIEKVRQTHTLLRNQPGFLQDFILEQSAGPGQFNIVTIVEWQNQQAVDQARGEVQALHRKTGFDPREMFTWYGIKADIANYSRLDI